MKTNPAVTGTLSWSKWNEPHNAESISSDVGVFDLRLDTGRYWVRYISDDECKHAEKSMVVERGNRTVSHDLTLQDQPARLILSNVPKGTTILVKRPDEVPVNPTDGNGRDLTFELTEQGRLWAEVIDPPPARGKWVDLLCGRTITVHYNKIGEK